LFPFYFQFKNSLFFNFYFFNPCIQNLLHFRSVFLSFSLSTFLIFFFYFRASLCVFRIFSHICKGQALMMLNENKHRVYLLYFNLWNSSKVVSHICYICYLLWYFLFYLPLHIHVLPCCSTLSISMHLSKYLSISPSICSET